MSSPPPAPTIEDGDATGEQPLALLGVPAPKRAGPTVVFALSESLYNPSHPRSLSMTRAVGDEAARHIKFIADQRLPINWQHLDRGECMQSAAIPLYHSHVLWSYAIRLKREEDGMLDLSIESVGPRLGTYNKETELTNNPPGLRAPPIISAGLSIVDRNGAERSLGELKHSDDSFTVVKRFSLDELAGVAVDGSLAFRLCLIVARAYFNLGTIIDLQRHKKSYAAEIRANRSILCEVLRGDRPAGWDCAFTNRIPGDDGEAGTNLFFAHKAPFVRISSILEAGLVESNTVHAPQLSNDALKLAIRIGYNIDVPLPLGVKRDQFFAVASCYKEHYETVLAKQWESEICARVLALDTSAPSTSSYRILLRLLNVIWDWPYGWFPIGKRVVIGVLADMMHQSEVPSVFDFVHKTLLPHVHPSGVRPEYLPNIVASLAKHIRGVAAVSKTGIVMETIPKEAPSPRNRKRDSEGNRKNCTPSVIDLT